MNGFIANVLFEQFQKVQDQTDLFGLLILTFIAIMAFRFLVAAAEVLATAVAGMVRVLSGMALPAVLILLLLMFAFGRI